MTGADPYRAPQAPVSPYPAATAVAIAPAGKWRRFFNWLIDRIVVLLLAGFVFEFLAGVASEQYAAWLESTNLFEDYLIGVVFFVLYYTPLEALFGVSLGKLITGTRVVDELGHPASFRQVLVRSLCRSIPFNSWSVLLSDDDRPRGWHDRIPRTWVVLRPGRVPQAPPVAPPA